jgi:hypothetical protein
MGVDMHTMYGMHLCSVYAGRRAKRNAACRQGLGLVVGAGRRIITCTVTKQAGRATPLCSVTVVPLCWLCCCIPVFTRLAAT